MNRNVPLLALCQAMLMTSVSLTITSSALIGARLAPYPALATAPLAALFLMTMLVMFPASSMMQRLGRRPIFITGALLGTGGVALGAAGIYSDSFIVFTIACALIGSFNGIGQFYRFAAVEAVDPTLQSRAISLTLAGGVIAAIIGPNLARLTRDTLQPPFTASYVALAVTTLIAVFLATCLRLPAMASAASGEKRPLKLIVGQPVFLVALAAATIGWAGMSLLMTATPLAMRACGLGFAQTATVLQWHIVAMFAPSFFTGDLIRRFSAPRVISAGCLFFLGAVAINLLGTTLAHFEFALILLGIGWNFLYVGGTALLTQAYRPAEKARVQALNDTVVFSMTAVSTLASAGLLSRYGWETINLAAIPAVAAMFVAAALLAWSRSRQASSPVTQAAVIHPAPGALQQSNSASK